MNNTEKIVLSEVYDVLKYMNKIAVMKIPIEILEYIKLNRDSKYVSNVDENDIFNMDNITKEALSILAWLDLNYLATEENKAKKLRIYNNNEEKYQKKLKEKYNEERLFDNIRKNENIYKIEEKDVINNENQMIKYKENIVTKLINFIKNLF